MNCSASIVYSNAWLNQTSNVGSSGSPLTLFTAASAGQFRLNVAGVSRGTTPPDVSVTSNYFSESITSSEVGSSTLARVCELQSGDAVTFYTDITTAGSGDSSYDVFVTIEQLQ